MFEFELSLLNFVVDTAPEDDNVEIKEEPIDDAELSSSKNDRLQPYYSEGLISDIARITHFIRGDSAPTPKPSRLRLTLAPPWTRIVQTSGASDTMARYRGVQPVRQCAELYHSNDNRFTNY